MTKAFAMAETTPVTIATGENVDEGLDNGGDDYTEEDLENDLGDEEPAPEPEPTVIPFEGIELADDVITDKYLRSALLALYRSAYTEGHPKYYTGSVIYSDMFKEFESINIDKKNISSLKGMEKLELDSLVSFSANSNEITSFDGSILTYIDDRKFTSLSLANNELSSLDVSYFENLTYLDVSSNKLSSLDLSTIEGKGEQTTVVLNLANNKFDSISDIVFPNKRIGHIELNIINNNITDLTDTYFSDFYTMHVGIQGFLDAKNPKVDTKNNLMIYEMNMEGLAVEIYKIDGEVDELVYTISDLDITDNFKRLDLPVGEYEYVYTLNGERAFSRYDYNRTYFDSWEFDVIPQKASYMFTYKGKQYEELGKVTGKVTVTLSTSEEGAKIFYQVNGGEWVEGTVVECDKGGSYSIKVKTVINGVESDLQNVWVRTSLNLYVPDALMLVLVVLLSLVIFLVVIPIISKKYFKKG
jgi:Leucine-rich repeat (LRR) protein